ncbi:hypothetical protein [Chitinophaga sp. YIM B06452]|uniref:hypothetical protein n=1 Tax=Chitinophaga sp. YIM B06452 TaxID=3082158 RepID=UPI0031FF1124
MSLNEDKVFTKNEAVSLMHRNTARSLRMIADHIGKQGLSGNEVQALLIEFADELEAQAVVVDLRDALKI